MNNDNPYIPHVEKFTKSSEFSYLAEYFNKHGMYTNLIPDTIEEIKFTDTIRDYCINGFTNSAGIKITGQHFFYLNFCPILGLNEKTGKKSKIFPRFIDLDYEFFWMVEYCRLNQKSLVAVKGRRQGWSYKAAAICTHEFYFYPDSKAVIGAFFSSFSQNTMNMVIDNSNFINTNTEFRKQRNPDLKDFIKARYQATVGGVKVWKGSNSEVRAISFKDNPTAAVGLSASWLILDEAGVFNNITDTYGYTEPLIKDGSTYTGVSLVFGSSGDMDSGSKYFYEMFTNPEKYNMLDFEDPFNPNARIGFFSSATKGRLGLCLNPESKWYKKPMVDEDGNSNHEAALDDIEFLRAKAKHGLDPKAIHNITTQFPTSWKEAFLRNKGNVFGSPEMLEWLGTLENTPSLRGQAQKGELFFDAGDLKWRPNDELNHITDFPLRKDPKSGESFSTDGCMVIWEHPEKDVNGVVPNYLYVAGCLTPGEKVLTDKGLMNIEDVTLDEKLINKDGELVEIINLQRYLKDNEDIYELKVSNTFRTTKFTQEHPIYVSDNILKSDKTINENLFNFEYQKVKNIKEDQWIKYPNIYLHDDNKIKSLLVDNNIWIQDLKEITSIENFTKDFYWFIGLWLGDGWCESNGYNVSIVFNKSEEYYINKCKEIIKNVFNRSVTGRVRGNCVQLSFSYKNLNNYLTNNFGKYSHGKFIPEWLKYSKEEIKLSLINGYLASDGCVHKSNTGYFTTEFVSVNLELLESIQDIMFSIGLVSSLNKLRDASEHVFRNKLLKTKETYHLRLGNFDTIELKKLLNNDDLKLSKIDLSNLTVRRKRAKDGCFLSDDKKYIYFKIREIKKTKYTGVVYNFECDTHTFMCHHINTHNCDPYDQDKSESGSLGSFFVYKRFYRADRTHDIIVAEYTSRPDTAEQFYENCRKLCIYYNSKVLYENQLKGLKVYFEQKNSLMYMCEQPGIIKDMIKDSRVQRGYGIHMNRGSNGASGIKDQCELYLKKWLYEEIDGPTEGSKILRFQTIKSIPLLKELIAYDREINTDRVIAIMLCILQTYELHRIHVEELSNTTSSSGAYLDKIWKKGIIFKGKNPSFNASIN